MMRLQNGTSLRGFKGRSLRHSITDSTALHEGQTVTCEEREESVFRWTNGELRGYPSVEIADSWNVRWRPEMAHVDCKHFPIGEDMPLKINEPVDDGTIVTCFGNEEKVYMLENGALRWLPNPQVAGSYKVRWRPEKVVDCQVFRFEEEMPLNDGEKMDEDPLTEEVHKKKSPFGWISSVFRF